MRNPTRQLYRCNFRPLTLDGFPTSCESGIEPFVDVEAANAEEASRRAYALKGCPITEVTRLEGKQPRTSRTRTARKPRPVIQLMTGVAMLAAMQAISDRKAA